MKIELDWNVLEDDFWIELGILYTNTQFHGEYNKLLSISLLFFTIYIRFNKKK